MAEVKSLRGRRSIPITEMTRRALLLQKSRLLGLGLGAHEYVFPTPIGTHYLKSNLQRAFYKLVEESGVPKIRFHDLRHTSITLRAAGGEIPAVLQELAGHANFSTTAGYMHAQPQMLNAAAKRMEAALKGGES